MHFNVLHQICDAFSYYVLNIFCCPFLYVLSFWNSHYMYFDVLDVRVGLWRRQWRIDAFELWCSRRLLRVPWTVRRSNQSMLKEISPGCSLEGLMLRLKLQWPPHAKRWLIGKDPDAGGDSGQEEKGMTEDQMAGWHHRLDAHEFGWTSGVSDGQGGLACCDSWGRKESDTIEQLN